MIKILSASADAYITDKIIAGERRTDANTGVAGTLDLFKLYGMNQLSGSKLTELSRVLIKFNLEPIKTLYQAGVLDPSANNFSAHVKLSDVYGGQPTPRNFSLVINPLSKSFDEGQGHDIARFDDVDVCNFLTASSTSIWVTSGANSSGVVGSNSDYLTALGATSFQTSQTFLTGEEDAWLDVTSAVSATLTNQINDNGFRIAYATSHETDNKTYFVKRFASRHAFDVERQPQLVVQWDDSILDDTLLLELDTTCSLYLYNRSQGQLRNIPGVTGQNSVVLRLTAPVSGGNFNLSFTGSQFSRSANNYVTGIYKTSVVVPESGSIISTWLTQTGSVKLTPVWEKLNGTSIYTGSLLTFSRPTRGSHANDDSEYVVSVTGIPPEITKESVIRVRINVFDQNSRVQLVKTPIVLPGAVVRDTHYSVRDTLSGRNRIPVDVITNSSRVSSDDQGMFFDLDASSLCEGHSYIIDVTMTNSQTKKIFKGVSPVFRVNSLL